MPPEKVFVIEGHFVVFILTKKVIAPNLVRLFIL